MSAPFDPTFQSEPFPDYYDPVLLDGAQFPDGQHRVIISKSTGRQLHKTADFVTFTVVDADYLPGVPLGGINTFQDAVVLPEGTFALYQNDGSEGTTAVWTGTAADIDAGTITRLGRVLSGGGDCGAFRKDGRVHIFTEDPASPFGTVSSSKILHFSTPDNDLLNATAHGVAFDTGGTWGTGDVEIVEASGAFWMFVDYTVDHPTYWIGLARSDSLYEPFELVDANFTASDGTRGGDIDLLDFGDHLMGFTEYTGADILGVGVWRLDKVPSEVRFRRNGSDLPAVVARRGGQEQTIVGYRRDGVTAPA